MKVLRQENKQPSKLGQLREELTEIQEAIRELQKKKREERKNDRTKRLELRKLKRSELQAKRKLNLVKLPVVQAKDNTPQNKSSVVSTEVGKASYYAAMFDGRTTASGAIFSNQDMTAAHKTLPFGTRVRVTNSSNGKSIEVTVTDRGPFVAGRIIDLTSRGFAELDSISRGVINVTVEVLD